MDFGTLAANIVTPMEKAFLTVIVTALAVLVAAASALVVLH